MSPPESYIPKGKEKVISTSIYIRKDKRCIVGSMWIMKTLQVISGHHWCQPASESFIAELKLKRLPKDKEMK